MAKKKIPLKFNIFQFEGDVKNPFVVEYWTGDDNTSRERHCASVGEIAGILVELAIKHFED